MHRYIYAAAVLLLGILASCSRPAVIQKDCAMCPPPQETIQPAEKPLISYNNMIFKKPQAQKGLIVVDAGHGGKDLGTHSLKVPKYQEKNLNLSTAYLLKDYLQKLGYQVAMTRLDDTFVSLSDRAIFANQRSPRLFVSVHYNSAPSKDATGIEVFYYENDEDKKRAAQSKMLAGAVIEQVIAGTNARSRGVKHKNLAVLRETDMPAVLVEGGFLTNDEELARIKDPEYMKQLAWGIAKGVDNYLKQN